MRVHILATCRSAELMRATMMVFQTLRVGFPTAEVVVTDNAIQKTAPSVAKDIRAVFECADHVLEVDDPVIHHEWIEGLITTQNAPFFILDTDVVFWDCFEDAQLESTPLPLAGRLVPRFFDSFTKCITLPRLHTSLLYINPVEARNQIQRYYEQFPDTPFNPKPNLIYPGFIPVRNPQTGKLDNVFHDTCCLLYQVVGGTSFGESELDRYDHLHFGTISDIVAPHYPDYKFREDHFIAFENPSLIRGHWRKDDLWYKSRAV